jgi:hypothetical protein
VASLAVPYFVALSHKWLDFSERSTRYVCEILMKLGFSSQIFEKYWDTKFHENLYIGSQVVPCGQTDMT